MYDIGNATCVFKENAFSFWKNSNFQSLDYAFLFLFTDPSKGLSFLWWVEPAHFSCVSETLHRPPEVCPSCLLRLPSPLAPLHCVIPQMPILFFPLSPKEAGHMVVGEETYFRDIRHHTSKTITYRLSLGPRSPGGLPLLQGDKLAALSHPNSPEMLLCP